VLIGVIPGGIWRLETPMRVYGLLTPNRADMTLGQERHGYRREYHLPEVVWAFEGLIPAHDIPEVERHHLERVFAPRQVVPPPAEMYAAFDIQEARPYLGTPTEEREEDLSRALLHMRRRKLLIVGFFDVTLGERIGMSVRGNDHGHVHVMKFPLEMSFAPAVRSLNTLHLPHNVKRAAEQDLIFIWDARRDIFHASVKSLMLRPIYDAWLDPMTRFQQAYATAYDLICEHEMSQFLYFHNIPYIRNKTRLMRPTVDGRWYLIPRENPKSTLARHRLWKAFEL